MSEGTFEEARVEALLDERYRLRREIARGGMGCVFEAEHLVTGARVAIKTMTRPALDAPTARRRLLREARILGALRHPRLVQIYDAGTCPRHGPYVVLEMIEGRPLDGILLTRRTLPVGQAVAIAVQLCEALDEVHRRGIVHRDVKPSNVLISKTPLGDQVELIDFGVATRGTQPDDEPEEPKLTRFGELLGTVEYMSPEQLMASRPVDARTDVYGVGVVLYECLTGEVPFSGSPTAVIATMLAGTRPASIRDRRGDVPLELEAVIRKALEVEPDARWPSVRELAHACTAALAGVVPALDLLDVRDDRKPPPPDVPKQISKQISEMPGAPEPQRRRRFVRAPYVTPVRIVLEGGACDGRTEDISEGGLLVVTDTDCAENQRVKVRLPLPTTGRIALLEATTRWARARRNQRAIGLEFAGLPEDVRREIRGYVAFMTGAPDPAPTESPDPASGES